MNTLMDDEIFALSYSGIISVLAATGIVGMRSVRAWGFSGGKTP